MQESQTDSRVLSARLKGKSYLTKSEMKRIRSFQLWGKAMVV